MKKILPILTTAIIIGGIAFYGGMQYGKSASAQSNTGQNNLQNLGQAGGNGGRRNGGFGQTGGVVAGDIISKDEKSITLKLQNGGSKIVFLSTGTRIMKSIGGSVSDLIVGERVTATGAANSDGSVVAQSIQLRPAMPEGNQGNSSGTSQPGNQ